MIIEHENVLFFYFFKEIACQKKENTNLRCIYIVGGEKMERLKNPIILAIIIGILFLTNICTIIYFVNVPNTDVDINNCDEIASVTEDNSEDTKLVKVDIKGYVKKPGVYEIEEGSIVNDLIALAGGLKTNGTTENLNLSKKLVDETVIVVSSKSALKKATVQNTSSDTTSTSTTTTTQSSTITTDSIYLVADDANSSNSTSSTSDSIENTTSKVSLNTATKEELMTLSGIGEAKALSIIEYREKQKFTSIEEIKNVSGIGDALYEKIKDNITI
jgi:competence protein ComEA